MGQLGDLSPQGSVAIGVLVGLVSTSVQSLGLTLQRKSHILEDEKDPHDLRRPPHRRRRWQLGMLMFIISNLLGSTIQITTLPLPVLSTLQASGLVFNSICATLILGEPFTRWSLGGTILVCGGAVLIAIFGAIGEPAHNLDQLLELLRRQQFVLWMIGQAILVVIIISSAKALKYLNPRNSNSPRMRLVRGMAYGAISGILSAHSLLIAKSAVELLVRTIVDRVNQFNRWESWVILLGLLTFALSQLYYLHQGLKLCSTSILYPFVFCVYNINAILDGLIYFHQTSQLSLLSALLIALGTLILLTGVLALSWRLNNDPSTRPPIAQNPLTPGLGFVDTESESSSLLPTSTEDEGDNDDRYDDEESAMGKESPYITTFNQDRTRPQSNDLRTPTSNNDFLNVTRLRRKAVTESQEIWEELEDASPLALPPSPWSRRDTRSSSLRSTASRPPAQRHGSAPVADEGDADDEMADEETALLGRSGTGRTYRDRRRRV
ncbi:hypothetical protein MMC29_006353, partial [Sticta canariensis]|nr:hypothetical protein [Sticta canariensis]